MPMRKIIILYMLMVAALCGFYQNSVAQRSFSDPERETIAGNIENLMQGFSGSLKFSIDISESTQQLIRQSIISSGDSLSIEIVDSIYAIKIDSLKQIERNKIAENLQEYFVELRKSQLSHIANFVFDTLIFPQASFATSDLIGKYTFLYSKVDGDTKVKYVFGDDTISNLRPFLKEAVIEKYEGGFRVSLPFLIGWLEGTYDTVQSIRQLIPKGEGGDKKTAIFSTRSSGKRNIGLTATVFFNKYDDENSYKLLSIDDYMVGDNLPELRDFLENGILNNLRLYGKLDFKGDKIDTTLTPLFLGVFDDINKDALDCSLFFSDTVCRQIIQDEKDKMCISPLQYVDQATRNYSYIQAFNINMTRDKIEVKDEKDYLVIKWPAEIEFVPRDFDDDVPDGLGAKTITNIYFLVNTKKPGVLQKNKTLKYNTAKITDIATSDKTISIKQPVKKGNFSISAFYNPMHYFCQIDDASAFAGYNSEFVFSHGLGFDFGYYWPAKKSGDFYGVSTGFSFEMMKSGMFMDSAYYNTPLAGSDIPIGSDNILYYEERVWLKDFNQSVKYNLLSIPINISYLKTLNSKSLFELGFGAKVSFVSVNDISLNQNSGTSTHKGWYQLQFPDQTTGEYLIEDVPEYDYETDIQATIYNYERDVSSVIISLSLRPSFSIPIEELVKNGHLLLGMNFQYGFNSIYQMNDRKNLLLEEPGVSNDVFSNGVKKSNFIVGFTIGFRYFDSSIHRADKSFRF